MENNNRLVYVVGHKNPDTDSICSAIAYAYLKNELRDGKKYIPMRAGSLNKETQFVLSYFDVPCPEYITNVEPQVNDVEIKPVIGVNSEISLKKAYSIMKANGTVTLPILTPETTLEGVITINDIAESDMDMYDNEVIGAAKTPLSNIVEVVEGELLVGKERDIIKKGKVLIAAANPDVMENYISDGDLVILGNRYEAQLCAIEMNAGCLIVCEGAAVSKTIKKLATEHKCAIICTKYDAYTTARLVNQSMPIRHFMAKENIISFMTEDSLDSIREVMRMKRFRDFPIIDVKGKYVGMISRRNLLNYKKKELILMDHNELKQAVDGANEAEILEIIDHHRLGTFETAGPLYFRSQPLGSTCTIVAQIYQEKCVEIPKKIAALLLSAIISDTLMFRSPTCTELDKRTAEYLAGIADVDIKDFSNRMFNEAGNMNNMSAEEIFFQDFKKFNIDDKSIGVGQITAINDKDFIDLRDKLIPYMDSALKELGVHYVFFMMTSIVDSSTQLLFKGDAADNLVENAFANAQKHDDYAIIPGMVSRKKQFLPAIIGYLQQKK